MVNRYHLGRAEMRSSEEGPFVAFDSYEKMEARVPAWIPVGERLPELVSGTSVGGESRFRISDEVLAFDSDEVVIGYIKRDSSTGSVKWLLSTDEGECFMYVTHWMPLPEGPEVTA